MSATSPDAVPAAADNRSGMVIAQRYRLQRRLGVGGMGEVYEAKHTELPRRFAVKLLRAELSSDPQMRERFRREAETAASLSSDHIVEVVDFGHDAGGSPYLVMELLDGSDLRRVLRQRGQLPIEQAVAVILQVCTGLAVPHARGIVHRDLKPENLFIARRGERTRVKVLDFGIAKLRHHSLGTGNGRLLGTAEYMPPEQVRGDADIDPRADIYALGVILYEALTGKLPHPGAEAHEVISHVLFQPPIPLHEAGLDAPEALAAVVARALAPKPADRFQNVGELANALATFAGSNELPAPIAADGPARATPAARSSEIRSRDDEPAAPSAPAGVTAEPAASHARGARPARYLLAAAALLATVGWWLLTALHAPARPAARAAAARTGAIALTPQVEPVEPAPQVEPVRAPEAPAVQAVAGGAPASAVGSSSQPASPRPTRTRPAVHRAAPAATASGTEAEPSVIEVRREERTLVFKRDNPLRR